MFEIVLFEPEIPPNTGNVIRLCANAGCRLHLVEPLGFEPDDAKLRRAGLDYHEWTRVSRHADLAACRAVLAGRRWITFSTRHELRYDRFSFQPGDALVFGPETRGLPDPVRLLSEPAERLALPMTPTSRSLNLSNAVAVAVYEAWRQQGFSGSAPSP